MDFTSTDFLNNKADAFIKNVKTRVPNEHGVLFGYVDKLGSEKVIAAHPVGMAGHDEESFTNVARMIQASAFSANALITIEASLTVLINRIEDIDGDTGVLCKELRDVQSLASMALSPIREGFPTAIRKNHQFLEEKRLRGK